MPFINDSPDMSAIMSLMAQNARRKDQQAMNMIAMAKPGQTIEQLGLTPKSWKRATGQDVQPGFVIKEDTAQHKMDLAQQAAIDKMNPQQLDVIATSATARDLGVPQITTSQGMADTATANTSKAKGQKVAAATIADMIEEGSKSVRAAPKAQRELAGQQAMMGTTLNSIEESDLGAKLKSEITRDAIKFTVNPAGHPLGKLLKNKFGIDPTAAVAAVGMGMNQMLHDVAELTIVNANNRGQRETAIQQRLAEAAGKLSEATGFKLNPLDVQRIWSMREAGIDPYKVKGLADAAQVMDAAAEMGSRAALAAAVEKGDPTIKNLSEQLALLKNAKSPEEVAAGSRMIQGANGRVFMTQLYGPRPAVRGPQQQAWDQMAQTLGAMSSGFLLKGGFFGGDLMPTGQGVPGGVGPTGFGERQIQAGAPSSSTSRTITLPDSVTPATQAAIQSYLQTFIGLSQDSTATPPKAP